MLTAREAKERSDNFDHELMLKAKQEEFNRVEKLIIEHSKLGHTQISMDYPMFGSNITYLRNLGYIVEALPINAAPRMYRISWKSPTI